MKIILADSHGTVIGKDQTSANLSLLYLGSYLEKHADFEVELIYIPQTKSIQYHLDKVAHFQPEIYAISFTSYSAAVAYELIKQIKEKFPNILVVCGGPHVTNSPFDVLNKSGADIAAIGEGEETFLEIASSYGLIHSAKMNIKGIAYLKNGHLHKTATRELINDIDAIPFPNRDLVNDADFCGLTYSKARPNTEMVVTRGCPMRCVFCANPVFRLKNGPLYRARSPKNIAEEVQELYQRGYREIYFHSDELNVQLAWSIEVCKELAALGHKDLYFQCNLRVTPMSEEFAFWLKKANFWLVRIGLETTSDRVLTGIKKKMSLEKSKNACRLLSAQGIKVFAFAMLFNYWEDKDKLQHDSLQEVQQTIKDLYSLWWKGYIHYTSWAFALPVQGSELYDIAIKHKMIDDSFYPGDEWNTFEHLSGITKKEFNQVYASARRQQAVMALKSGNIEWRNYKGLARKAMTMLRGKPD